jgi:hypothetical protein
MSIEILKTKSSSRPESPDTMKKRFSRILFASPEPGLLVFFIGKNKRDKKEKIYKIWRRLSVIIRVCKRIGLIDFELNRQILGYLDRFFGLKISVRLKILINSVFFSLIQFIFF